MKRKKHLRFNEFSCNWETERISFNKTLSRWLFEGGYEYARFLMINGVPHLILTKDKIEGRVNIYYSTYTDGSVRAQIYKKPLTREILSGCKCENESWYMVFEGLKNENQLGKFIKIKPIESMEKENETKVCAKCGRELPVSEYYAKGDKLQSYCKDCMKEHGRLRNGTTGEYRQETINEIPQGMTQDEYGHALALIKAGYKITVERPAVKLIG